MSKNISEIPVRQCMYVVFPFGMTGVINHWIVDMDVGRLMPYSFMGDSQRTKCVSLEPPVLLSVLYSDIISSTFTRERLDTNIE